MDVKFVSLFLLFVIMLIFLVTREKKKFVEIEINGKRMKAEVADTPWKRARGLMFRKKLPNDKGMLFVFEKEGVYGFWMVNMTFPIDIIWIDKNRTIVDITENAQPCLVNCKIYRPSKKVLYVLEVNASFTEKYNVKIGDKVKFQF